MTENISGTKKPRGRPPHQPTEKTREEVKLLAGFGIPQEGIAQRLKISVDTLVVHYREELDEGVTDANAKVAGSLFKNATGDDAKSVTAAIFWLKTRAGFKEKTGIELTGKNDGPVQVVDVNKLTDQQLETIAEIMGTQKKED